MSVRNILANAYFPLALLCACGGNSPSRSTTASPESTDAEPFRSDSDDGTLVRTKEGLARDSLRRAAGGRSALASAAAARALERRTRRLDLQRDLPAGRSRGRRGRQ